MTDGYFIGPDNEPDKYRLLTQVGSGGEAQLWKAELTVAGQSEPVAVKILRPDRLSTLGDWKARWAEQAELLHFIRHPGVVGVREHFEGAFMHYERETITGSVQRSLYLVMNWVDGQALREWVPLHRSPEAHFEGLRYMAQLGDVLDWLHSGQATPSQRPIIHADVTPANVIVTAAGQAVLVDFGLVRVAGGLTDAVEGTRGYMAPEVLSSGAYSPASDRYAFGAVTYFVITGEHPPTDVAQIAQRLQTVPFIAAEPGLIHHVMAIFNPDPAARPPAGEWIRRFRISSSTATAMAGMTGLRSAPPGTSPTAPLPAGTAPTGQHRGPLIAAAAVGLVIALIIAGLVISNSGKGNTAASTHNAVATTLVPVTTETPTTSATEVTTTTFPSFGGADTPTTSPVQDPNLKAAYLDDLKTVDGEATPGQAKANAVQYLHAVTITAYQGGRQYAEYDLSRSWNQFSATVAVRDDMRSDSSGAYALYFDGVKASSGLLRLGTSTPVKLPATNVLRVRLEVTNTDTNCCSDLSVVFGDPQITR